MGQLRMCAEMLQLYHKERLCLTQLPRGEGWHKFTYFCGDQTGAALWIRSEARDNVLHCKARADKKYDNLKRCGANAKQLREEGGNYLLWRTNGIWQDWNEWYIWNPVPVKWNECAMELKPEDWRCQCNAYDSFCKTRRAARCLRSNGLTELA